MFRFVKIVCCVLVLVLLPSVSVLGDNSETYLTNEDFEFWNEGTGLPQGWEVTSGNLSDITVSATAYGGTKAIKMTGTSETSVLRISKLIKMTTGKVYDVSGYLKILEHTAGSGAKVYYSRTSDLSATYGNTGYFTGASDNFKKLSFRAAYVYDPGTLRDGYLVIEYSGKGSVIFDDFSIRETGNGLTVNGDFDGLTNDTTPGAWTFEKIANYVNDEVNGTCVSVASANTNWAYYNHGMPVSGGESYKLRFSYKNEAKTPPYVFLYFASSLGTNGYETLPTTNYDPWYTNAPTHNGWTEYTVSFVIPENTTIVYFNKIGLRGRGSTISYYDNIRLLPDNTDLTFLTANNEALKTVPRGGTVRAKCYFVYKEPITESVPLMLVNAVYSIDENNNKSLVNIKINNTGITGRYTSITADVTVPSEEGVTYTVESFAWDSSSNAVPYTEKSVLMQ